MVAAGSSLQAQADGIMSREQYATAIMRSQPQWARMAAHEKAGTPYSISQQELNILQDPLFGPGHRGWRPFPQPVSLLQAHASLQSGISKRASWAQVAARQRLLDAHNAPYGTRSPGLLIKMINDIDAVLFGGVLRNRLLVHWVDYSAYTKKLQAASPEAKTNGNKPTANPSFLATTVVPPQRFRESVRPAIYLSAEIMCLVSQSQVKPLALLIHEMLHAYLSLLSRPKQNEEVVEYDDHGYAATEHDALFEASCSVLANRLGFRGVKGRDILHYYRHPLPVQLPRADERRKVRLQDGLVHHVLPMR